MSDAKKSYESTVMRMAGNIAGSMITGIEAGTNPVALQLVAESAVALARAIVAEVERTEPRRD